MFKTLRNITGSIGVKFAAAMIAMGAMTAASGAISYFAFDKISAEFRILVDEHVVKLRHASEIIEASDRLKSGLTEVLLTQTSDDLTARMGEVDQHISHAAALISKLSEQEMAEFTPMLDAVTNGLDDLASARTDEFGQRDFIHSSIAALSKLSDQAHATLNFQADDARYELKLGTGRTIKFIDETLTHLVENDFKTLQLLLQTRAENNMLSGLVLALAETDDRARRPILEDLGEAAIVRFGNNLAELQSRNLDEGIIIPLVAAQEFYQSAIIDKTITSFKVRKSALNVRQESEAALSIAVDDVLFSLSIETEDVAEENSVAIRNLLDNQVKKIIDVAQLKAAVEAMFTISLEAISTQNADDLDRIQNRIRAASIKLKRYAASGGDTLTKTVEEILLVALPESGITSKQRAFLEAQAQSAAISRTAADKVTEIADLARKFGQGAMANITDSGMSTAREIQTSQQSMQMVLMASVAIFLATLGAIFLSVVRPLGSVSRSTEQLASGDMSALDTLKPRNGEIGRLTDALIVFRTNLIANQKMEEEEKQRTALEHEEEKKAEIARHEKEENDRRVAADLERQEREEKEAIHAREEARRQIEDEENQRRQTEQASVVSELAHGLETLAAGDLSIRINAEFPEAYVQLRDDFNATVIVLEDLIRSISSSGETIYNNAGEISDAADHLSRRTEESASTLEETSSALGELTNAVKATSEGASKADAIVGNAKESAQKSGEVVRETVTAMAQIEESSREISKIITVIDDIAFQTNLLALNAGVEAARAGDAGRGFAVVATEVRSLAHRSSDAAKEISALISQSGQQVERGVSLVDETGTALQNIVGAVSDISQHVSEIARSAEEQASGVAEINAAIVQLDQVTQQNTAMFEETAAATHSLKDEASELSQMMAKFRVGDENQTALPIDEEDEDADEFAQNGAQDDESPQDIAYDIAGE